MTVDSRKLTFGFIGTGTITEAVVTGLGKTEFQDTEIVVSPRSEAISARLAAENPNVSVAASNQGVVDRADLVFIAVRPQIAEAVVRALRFRPTQHVISFVAATPLDRLRDWIGQPLRLGQAIPLPFVADLQGATAIHPPDDVSFSIFSVLGTAIQVETKAEYDLLAAASALMGTYFGILDNVSAWLEQRGLSRSASDAYLRQLFSGLNHAASLKPQSSFAVLAEEHSTKGGLNEQMLEDFNVLGGREAIDTGLARLMTRIQS
jgi:pyrroline-5-carboxylate reductase